MMAQPVGDTPTFLLPTMAVPHRTMEADWIEQFVKDELGWKTLRDDSTWETQGDAIFLDEDHVILTYGEGPDARTSLDGLVARQAQLASQSFVLKFCANPWFHGNHFKLTCEPLAKHKSIRCKHFIIVHHSGERIGETGSARCWTASVHVSGRVTLPEQIDIVPGEMLIA